MASPSAPGPGAGKAEDDYVSCSVFVAVRARPFNGRERKMKARSCLHFYEGNSVQITAPDATGKKSAGAAPSERRSFTFDRAYNMDSQQDAVFRDVGMPVVEATMQGYNACIFAYGQTGSGKSFSMLGPSDAAHILAPPKKSDMAVDDEDASAADTTDADDGAAAAEDDGPVASVAVSTDGASEMYEMRGLIPRILEHVFQDIEDMLAASEKEVERTKDLPVAERAPKLEVTVTVSYLEIYQEKVRCLLRPDKGSDLRVRNDPKKGAFVDNLTKERVSNAAEALKLLSRGNSERVVGSTNMNDKSSRSHAIFAFEIEQTRTMETEDGPSATKLSSAVNLVDLAGSERAKSTGAEGERLREGAGINKSLSVLGLVISSLADAGKATAAGSSKKPAFIPYRDSKLTWLLKENLGGNSKTFMLSALSPADVNYDETLSTLRYADRAKSIVTKACINEDAKDKVIRQLQAEVAKLKEMAASPAATSASGTPPAAAAGLSPATAAAKPSDEAPFLVGLDGVSWHFFRAGLGATLVIGKSPNLGRPEHRVAIGEAEDEDLADLHAELQLPQGDGPALLRAVSLPDFLTFVDGEELTSTDAVPVVNNAMITFGDGVSVRYADPRAKTGGTRRQRGQSMAVATSARRGSASLSPQPQQQSAGDQRRGKPPLTPSGSSGPTPRDEATKPAVPPLALSARATSANGSAREGGAPAGAVPKLMLGSLDKPVAPKIAPNKAPLTTRLTQSTPRAGTGSTTARTRFAVDARDELVAINNHTFVLLGDCDSGKTAFRGTLGKEWGFFDTKKLPDTRPTLGFEVERLEGVGSTTKTDLTFVEISGNRAFSPLTWIIPAQSRTTFMIFFRLHGTREYARCDLQYFQPFVDVIRNACPTSDNTILLIGTHRDCLPDVSDSAVMDMMQAIQAEVTNYWATIEPVPENRPVIRARFAVSALQRSVVAGTTGAPRSNSSSSGGLTARLFGPSGGPGGNSDASIKKMSDMLQWLVGHAISRWRDDHVFVKGLVPKRVLTLIERVRTKRGQGRYEVPGPEWKEMAREIDPRYSNTKEDLLTHTQLLHAWLRVFHHFRHSSLKKHVFIDVEWTFRILMTYCCCGALVQRGAFNEPSSPPPTDAAERFLAHYRGLPFDVEEVRRADGLRLLWTGLLTTQTASYIFRKVIAEKRYTATEVAVALDILSHFDLVMPATKLLELTGDEGSDDDVAGGANPLEPWTNFQLLVANRVVEVTRAPDVEPVYVLPGLFSKPAPEMVTVFVPELLGSAGSTVCFTLASVPVRFFSRLLTRLSTFAKGVYFGSKRFWGDCAWLVASDRCRVLLRLVSRSLFVTFHDHDEVKSIESQQARSMHSNTGMTARGPAPTEVAESSTLDDECYEAYLAMLLNAEGLSDDEQEARYLAIRRGMLMRRETDLQWEIRQQIRDLIGESPGASYKERDRLPLCEGSKWREVTGTVRGATMYPGQREFIRLRELIAKQQEMAEASGVKPYFSPLPGEEAAAEEPAAANDDDVGAQAQQLHERYNAEADDADMPSHAFGLDVDVMLERLTNNRFLSNAMLKSVTDALSQVAEARDRINNAERDRYRLFVDRDARGDDPEAEAAVVDRLPMLAMVEKEAERMEAAAIDRLVAALAVEGV